MIEYMLAVYIYVKLKVLLEYSDDFEEIGSLFVGEIGRKTIITFRKVDDSERYINYIDVDYDSKDVFLTSKM